MRNGEFNSDLFRHRLQRLLYHTPFIQADIAKMLEVAEATVCGWTAGVPPDTFHLLGLCHILFGVDVKYLLGFTEKEFPNGQNLNWQRQNVPQGEKDLLPYVRLVSQIAKKPACAVYRYDQEGNAFVLAAYYRYGCGLQTKFRYRVGNENQAGNGVTGNLIRKYQGRLLCPTRADQQVLADRITPDEGAFLFIHILRNREGEPLGCVKIEDVHDGSESDLQSHPIDDILTLGRIYLENTGLDDHSREWWRLQRQVED